MRYKPKKKIALVIILSFIFTSLFSQNSLTKKQMYTDFDHLVNIIEKCNVQLPIRKAVTGIDQIKTIKSLRIQIDTINSKESFYNLLRTALNNVMDAHSREVTDFHKGIDNLDGIDTISMKANNDYYSSEKYSKLRKSKSILYTYPLTVVYFDDNYYIIGNHKIFGKQGDTLNIHLFKLISYNGFPIATYIAENVTEGYMWDYNRKKYYVGDYWGFHFPRKGFLKGEQDGKIIEFNIADYPNMVLSSIVDIKLDSVPKRLNFYTKQKKVDFIEKDSILYIYLDKMIEDSSFYSKIKEIGRNRPIKKVVIDVRNNLGGSDRVWHKILRAIIKDTINYQIKLAFNDNKLMIRKLKGYNFTFEKISWLNNQSYGIISDGEKIIPDSNSLKYTGKIYILGNERTYSAAHSILNIADQFDQLVSIGCTTGQIVGLGIGPSLFQLKNSKFSFRLACTMDILNAEKPIDVYKDFPEVIVNPTLEEKLLYPNSEFDIKSVEFLYKHDSMFKKVLTL